MARLVAEAVAAADGLTLTSLLSLRQDAYRAPVSGVVGALRDVPGPAPVVVDFTAREATAQLLREAAWTPCALVIGTSGLTDPEREQLRKLVRTRAIVSAANFSPALAAVHRFTRDLAGFATATWDAGIVDIHFAGKRDAPSATALMLAEAWRGQRRTAARPHIASFRFGDTVSEHRLVAGGAGEQVEVCHRVTDRAAFVPGILAAIRFAHQASPGLYSLEDALCG